MKSLLDELGTKHKTDKASVYPYMHRMHSLDEFKHDYLRHYETFLEKLRHDHFQLVEIGVLEGASLRMWKEYFPNAQIVGIDIDPACAKYAEDRITIHIADGTTEECAAWVRANCDHPLIIIDDGGHTWKMQQKSLELFFPILAPGGFYIVEDVLSYSNKYDLLDAGGCSQDILDYLFERIRFISVVARPEQKMEALKRMPPPARYISRQLDGAYLMNCTCILKKKHTPDNVPYTVDVAGNYFRENHVLPASATLGDAILRMLAVRPLAQAVCGQNGDFIGLVTYADLKEAFGRLDPLTGCIADYCNKTPVTLASFDDEEFFRMHVQKGFTLFPVVDGGRCLGIKYRLENVI